MLAYYGAVVLGKGDSAARTIIHAIAILTVVISAYAIIEFLFNNNMIYGALTEEKVPIRSEEFHRSGSTLAQPVALGIYLVMTIPLLVYSFVMSGNFSRRVFWGVAIVAALAALLVSFSKGSWLTAIIIGFMAFVYLLVERRKFKGILRPVITLIASSLLIFTLIVSISYRNVAFNVFSPERRLESFGFRKHMWEKVPGEFGEHVLIGVGMWQGDDDLYRIAYAEEASEGLEYGEGLIPIDNLYLTVLLEGGLVGISLLAVTLFLIGRQALTIIRSGGTRATFTIPLAAGMVALLINGATADTLMVWPVMVVFWLYAGLIRARAEDGQDNR
ncbi:MAG: O-antigen ligase family protein [Bacteroidales bacterium]